MNIQTISNNQLAATMVEYLLAGTMYQVQRKFLKTKKIN